MAVASSPSDTRDTDHRVGCFAPRAFGKPSRLSTVALACRASVASAARLFVSRHIMRCVSPMRYIGKTRAHSIEFTPYRAAREPRRDARAHRHRPPPRRAKRAGAMRVGYARQPRQARHTRQACCFAARRPRPVYVRRRACALWIEPRERLERKRGSTGARRPRRCAESGRARRCEGDRRAALGSSAGGSTIAATRSEHSSSCCLQDERDPSAKVRRGLRAARRAACTERTS